MLKYDQAFTLEELEEITATLNEPKQSKQNEEEEEPVKLDFSYKSINEVFLLAYQLTERVLETGSLNEIALKFKRENC